MGEGTIARGFVRYPLIDLKLKQFKAFYSALVKRLNKFNLEIAEDKTKIMSYGARPVL